MLTILTVNAVFVEVLIGAIGTIGTALVSYLTYRLGVWLKSKVKNEKLQAIIDHTLGFTEDVVISINQTYVDALKDKDAFDKKSQKAAFNKAFTQAKSMISEDGKKLLEKEFGDVDVWLTALIESKVEAVKYV